MGQREMIFPKENRRNKGKERAEDTCLRLLEEHPEFRGDDLHALAVYQIKQEFGVDITPEIVARWSTLDRSKRAVQTRAGNEWLDQRTISQELEENDREYYGSKK